MVRSRKLRREFSRRFIEHKSSLIYPPVRVPFDILVEKGATGAKVPKEDLDVLLACVKWEIPPPFVSEGRGALAQRTKQLRFKDRNISFYKLKGCGAHQSGIVVPPNPNQFIGEGILVHMGINPDGTFRPVPDPPKPLGGLGEGRGKREFDNAVKLFNANVPAVIPVFWGTYKELKFQGKNMEFVILGIDAGADERVAELFESTIENGEIRLNPALTALMDSKVDYYSPEVRGNVALMCISEIVSRYGKTLSDFHDAGLARFAGHSGNYSYGPENKVILHDLDSCVAIDEIDPAIIGLSKVRDIESALFGLFHSYVHSRIYKMVDPANRRKYHLFRAFLEGYFKDDKKALNAVGEFADKLQDRFDNEAFEADKLHDIYQVMMWIQNLNYTLVPFILRELLPIYALSEQAAEHRLPYGQEQFDANFSVYAQQVKREHERIHRERMEMLANKGT